MDWIISNAPAFLVPVLEPMPSWGFWEWLNAIATLGAVGAFIVAALIFVYRYLRQRYGGPILSMAIRFTIKGSAGIIETLYADLTRYHWFQLHPEMLTAYAFKNTVRGALFIFGGAMYWIAGGLSWLPFIEPVNILVGMSLMGLGAIDLLYVHRDMKVFITIEKHAKKTLSRVEQNLQTVERVVPDDCELHESFAKLRWAAWHLSRVAEIREQEVDLAIMGKLGRLR